MDYEKTIIRVTVYDFLKLKKMKAIQMAKDTGISQAYISKLKLNQISMTKRTKEILERTYPGYIFTAEGLDANWAWKQRYHQMLGMYRQSLQENKQMLHKLNEQSKIIKRIKRLSEEL